MSSAIIVLTFSLIGHKEYRFYYPATTLFISAVGWGIADLGSKAFSQVSGRKGWAAASAVLVAAATIVIAQAGAFQDEMRKSEDNMISAEMAAARSPDICGLLVTVDTTDSAGHVYFDKAVPFLSKKALQANDPDLLKFNYMIARRGGVLPAGFLGLQCWTDKGSKDGAYTAELATVVLQEAR